MIKTAVILASGNSQNLKELTDVMPKPLIRIAGRSIIKRAIDRLVDDGIEKLFIVTNSSANKIIQRLSKYEKEIEINFITEDKLKGTLGSVIDIANNITEEEFFVVNSDILWLYSYKSSLKRMMSVWNSKKMSGLLLSVETPSAHGEVGYGDFHIDPTGKVSYLSEAAVCPWVFTGIQIITKQTLSRYAKSESYMQNNYINMESYWQDAIEEETLYSVIHDSVWFHIDDSKSLAQANEFLSIRYAQTSKRS